jgi:hypothetical protein
MNCPIGKFRSLNIGDGSPYHEQNADGSAAQSCTTCPATMYTAVAGSTTCTYCERGLEITDDSVDSSKHDAHTSCSVCAQGKYMYDFNDITGPFYLRLQKKSRSHYGNVEMAVQDVKAYVNDNEVTVMNPFVDTKQSSCQPLQSHHYNFVYDLSHDSVENISCSDRETSGTTSCDLT